MGQEWEQRSAGSRDRRLAMPLILVGLGVIAAFVSLPEGSPDRTFSVIVDDTSPPLPAEPATEAAEADESASAKGRGRWRKVDGGPLRAREDALVVTGGGYAFIWGGRAPGSTPGSRVYVDGATYQPSRDRWQRVPEPPISPRTGASAAWTGREFVVWGGAGLTARDGLRADGAAFDPQTRRWRRVARSPLEPRQQAQMVSTGGKVIVWGGRRTGRTRFADGAAYDPATDRWRRLPPGPLSNRRDYDVSTVALDGGMFVWSSSERSAVTAFYDVRAREWRTLVTPSFRPGSGPVFTPLAGAVLAWGESTIGDKGSIALTFTTRPDWWSTVAEPPVAPGASDTLLAGNGLAASPGSAVFFDLLANRWDAMKTFPKAAPAVPAAAVQAAGTVFVWHGAARRDDPNRALTWRPPQRWRGVPGTRTDVAADATATWTGWLGDQQQILLLPNQATRGGALYTPSLDRWEKIDTAPLPRRRNPAVEWSGAELIVYGGRSSGRAASRRGAAFDPVQRTWRTLPLAPFELATEATAWARTELYAAGRDRSGVRVARFHPNTDRWHRLPPPPLPASGKKLHVVWSGFETWVWNIAGDGTASGAGWDPVHRTWRRLHPLGRLFSTGTVVAAGRRMMVIGRDGTTKSLGWGTEGWRRHPRSPLRGPKPVLAWTGRRVVAYSAQQRTLVSLDPRAAAWSTHAAPALRPSRNAVLLHTGRHLFARVGRRMQVLAYEK